MSVRKIYDFEWKVYDNADYPYYSLTVNYKNIWIQYAIDPII